MNKAPTKRLFLFSTVVMIGLLFSSMNFSNVSAQTVDELRQKIDEQQKRINEIDREIEEQRQKVTQTAGQATSLANTISTLEATKAKLGNDILETSAQITKSELTLQKLGIEIITKEEKIEIASNALAESLRGLERLEQTSVVEKFLAYDNFSDFWNELRSLEQFQDKAITNIADLKGLHLELNEKKDETIEEKDKLENFKTELKGETEAVEYTKKEKAVLLVQTKNEEATYRQLLDKKLEERAQFEKELYDFESQLKQIVDPTSYPESGKGVFSWPVDNVIITQGYGETEFAKSTTLYSRPFHNGVDFGVPLGTKVKAVLGGTVSGTDNTDLYAGCRSWGNWILIKHDNGLSTLYAHLSSSLVSAGQRVERGEIIGLSGSTGVSTGPHLHLTTYASQGVQVRAYRDIAPSSYGCGATGATIPTASLDSYLNPFNYLP